MKMLNKLEKNKTIWFILAISLIFFVLRLPSLIEPNWYGDEGIYQVIGRAVSQNRLLYVQIFDNKPPLLYLTYALFGGNQFLVRLFSLIIGLISTWAFFGLSNLLFNNKRASLISTSFFAFIFSLPLIEGNIANAENFMLLPIILSAVIINQISIKDHPSNMRKNLFLAGLLLGIAFLFKIVAIFDLSAFFLFLYISSLKPFNKDRSRSKKPSFFNSLISSLKPLLIPFIVGFIIPIGFAFLYFFARNALGDFTKAAFFSNVGYVGYGNKFIIPQGLLILKLILLSIFSLFLVLKRSKFSKSDIFILLWFAFSLFNTYFSGRPYTHYALTLLPSFCLILGMVFTKNAKSRILYLLILLLSIIFVNNTFKFNTKKTVNYYSNVLGFLTGRKSVSSYYEFFDHKTPRDYEIASYIKMNSDSEDNIFLWGDSAQIYALSNKLPPGKYTVAYHIKQYKNGLKETQEAISKAKPKYIITLPESEPIPFDLPNYTSKFIFNEATIYERSF